MIFNSVIIGNWCRANEIAAASLKQPGAVYIGVNSAGMAARSGVSVKARPNAIRLFLWLCSANGRTMSVAELTDMVYGDAADGGPENAEEYVRKIAADAKIIGAALGVVVEANGNRGYSARIIERAAA